MERLILAAKVNGAKVVTEKQKEGGSTMHKEGAAAKKAKMSGLDPEVIEIDDSLFNLDSEYLLDTLFLSSTHPSALTTPSLEPFLSSAALQIP